MLTEFTQKYVALNYCSVHIQFIFLLFRATTKQTLSAQL